MKSIPLLYFKVSAVYTDLDIPISNDIKWSSTDSLGRQKIAKGNKNSLLAMEDDSVVMVNITRVENSYTMQSMTSSMVDDNCSRSAVGLCGSGRREALNPLDMCSNSITRSPSASPKMRKKTQVSLPQKPGAIDNSPLVQMNAIKVGSQEFFLSSFWSVLLATKNSI